MVEPVRNYSESAVDFLFLITFCCFVVTLALASRGEKERKSDVATSWAHLQTEPKYISVQPLPGTDRKASDPTLSEETNYPAMAMSKGTSHYNRQAWEDSNFPILCKTCLGKSSTKISFQLLMALFLCRRQQLHPYDGWQVWIWMQNLPTALHHLQMESRC